MLPSISGGAQLLVLMFTIIHIINLPSISGMLYTLVS